MKGDADPANAAKPPDELVFFFLGSRRVRNDSRCIKKENLQLSLGLMDVLGEQLLV